MKIMTKAAIIGGICLLATLGLAPAQMLINGAGATFPYPLYSKWFSEYTKVDPSARFNYQAIGSGGGQRQIRLPWPPTSASSPSP